MTEFKGIDVSKHNGTIDFKKVKTSGIDFVIIRAGYGRFDNQKDPKFETNYKNAKAAGLKVGAYIYSYAKTVDEAKQEAKTFLNWLKGKTFEMPVYFDIEDPSQANLKNSTISSMVKAFCSTVEAAGYFVGIYANLDWLNNRIDTECKEKYDIWLAQWTKKPTFKGSYGMWQYSASGKVNGINGVVDMNKAYKDYATIIKKNGLNGFTKTTTENKPAPEAPKPTVTKPTTKVYKKGDAIKLKNAPLYASSTDTKAKRTKTGTFYIYDGKKVNGRYRITIKKGYCGIKPAALFVTGWVKLK